MRVIICLYYVLAYIEVLESWWSKYKAMEEKKEDKTMDLSTEDKS